MTPPTVVLHSVPEALELLGKIGRTTLYAMIRQGEIGTVHIGNRVFIPSDEIASFIDRNRHNGPTDAAMSRPVLGKSFALDADGMLALDADGGGDAPTS